MPRQGLCSFEPNCKDTNTIYITAVYFNNEGVQHFMAENVPHAKNHKAIITSTGHLVDAKSLHANSWLDKSGKDHKTKVNVIRKRAEKNAEFFQAVRGQKAKKCLKAMKGDPGAWTELSISVVGSLGGVFSRSSRRRRKTLAIEKTD